MPADEAWDADRDSKGLLPLPLPLPVWRELGCRAEPELGLLLLLLLLSPPRKNPPPPPPPTEGRRRRWDDDELGLPRSSPDMWNTPWSEPLEVEGRRAAGCRLPLLLPAIGGYRLLALLEPELLLLDLGLWRSRLPPGIVVEGEDKGEGEGGGNLGCYVV